MLFRSEEFINDRNSNNILNPKSDFDLKYILGLINSKLVSYWFVHTFDKFQRKIFPQFKVNELAQFPIYPASKDQQKKILLLVDKLLQLVKDMDNSETKSNKWNSIKSTVEKTDRKIDEEVYELYRLTLEEIEIVEGKQSSAFCCEEGPMSC